MTNLILATDSYKHSHSHILYRVLVRAGANSRTYLVACLDHFSGAGVISLSEHQSR